MTDDSKCNIYPKLCQGIGVTKGVLENFWVVFSWDGFGTHLDAKLLMVFHANKILVIKEEGDTSQVQVSQAYNQIVAKEHEYCARDILEMTSFTKRQ